MNFSLRALLLIIIVGAIVAAVFNVVFRNPRFAGPVSNIGSGHEEAFYFFDNNGAELGRLEVQITEEITASQPTWAPSSSNPPVSAADALRLADRFRRDRFLSYSQFQWSLSGLCLTPLNAKDGKWCWVAHFELSSKPDAQVTASQTPVFKIFIMMDRSVLIPDDPDGFLSVHNKEVGTNPATPPKKE